MFAYEKPCSEDCGRLVGRKGGRGLCASCNQKRHRLEYEKNPTPCAIEGCDQPSRVGIRYCYMHASRVRRNGEPGPAEPMFIRGEGTIHTGYRVMRVDGKSVPQHRLIVEAALGRSLWPYENVHHKNGLRADNRLENLEIWIVPQPFGQRPEDLLAWCDQHRDSLVEAAEWNAA